MLRCAQELEAQISTLLSEREQLQARLRRAERRAQQAEQQAQQAEQQAQRDGDGRAAALRALGAEVEGKKEAVRALLRELERREREVEGAAAALAEREAEVRAGEAAVADGVDLEAARRRVREREREVGVKEEALQRMAHVFERQRAEREVGKYVASVCWDVGMCELCCSRLSSSSFCRRCGCHNPVHKLT